MKTLINPSQRNLYVRDLGIIDYHKAYDMQCEAVDNVIKGEASTLFMCEHPAVFTLGRLASSKHILSSENEINKIGVDIVRINRGGEVTFHGLGQLVVYPIFRLQDFDKDLRHYMEQLEQVAIDLLQYFGIVANRVSGQRGVWAGTKKIASIGIGVRKWVSFHGMAINVNTDLTYFKMIKPCGLDVSMTSMQQIKSTTFNINLVKDVLADCFCKTFDFVSSESAL